jgi:carboxyl-terminal processing protease
MKPDINQEDLFKGSIDGMLSIMDENCEYIPADKYDQFLFNPNKNGGIGIEIKKSSDGMLVAYVFPETPASKAGIKNNDIIISIAGQSTKNINNQQAIDLLKGTIGSTVDLEIIRNNNPPFKVSIRRKRITINPVSSKLLKNNIGYIKIRFFQIDTTDEVKNTLLSLRKMNKDDLQGLILDLRRCSGGLLSSAVDISDLFLTEGLIVKTNSRRLEETKEYLVKKKESMIIPISIPIVILVDKSTMAGAEIITASLQDHKRGIIVGCNTFGKDSIQTISPLIAGDALKLTVSNWIRPSGISIREKGVFPDICFQGLDMTHIDIKELLKSDSNPKSCIRNNESYYPDESQDIELDLAKSIINGKN